MTLNNLIDKLFVSIDETDFAVLCKLMRKADKNDIIKLPDDKLEAVFKGKDGFGIGRDKATKSLSSLASKGYIKKEQKRDENGKFVYNEITILQDLL